MPRVVGDPIEENISASDTGGWANGASNSAAISGDGRYVVFNSDGTNLVPGGSSPGLFVRDRVAGATRRVTDTVWFPSISADGRYISFATGASLVPNDTSGPDVYLYDQTTNTFELISVSTTGAGSGTTANDLSDMKSSVSQDGRYVAFASNATDIAPGDTDLPPQGLFDPHKDGKWPDVYLRDRTLGTTTFVSVATDSNGAFGSQPVISTNGSTVAFTGSANTAPGGTTPTAAMVYDVATRAIRQASVDSNGSGTDGVQPAISADGNVVVFSALGPVVSELPSPTVAHLYARDLSTGTTTLVDVDTPDVTADREPLLPSLSADGRYVAFACWCQRVSAGANPGMGHLGMYRVDRTIGSFDEIDANLAGVVANADVTNVSSPQAITGDGQSITFVSPATNLLPDDSNGLADIFLATVP